MGDAADWIEWAGGECPVDPDMMVDYRLDNPRAESSEYARALDWASRDPFIAIIAYRPLSQAPR
jgi:hypothetical protein